MAERVIRVLEAVDVEEDDGIADIGNQVLDGFEQAAAVVDAGHLVDLARAVEAVHDIAVADQDGDEARERREDLRGIIHLLGRRVDGFEQAVRLPVEAHAREDGTLEVRDVRRILRMLAPVFVEVADDKRVLVREALVEMRDFAARDGREILCERQDVRAFPAVGEADVVALFLEEQHAVAAEAAAIAREDFLQAGCRLGVAHADADGVIGSGFALDDGVLLPLERLVVAEVEAEAEYVALAAPWDQRVAHQQVAARVLVVMELRMETAARETFLRAVVTRRCVAVDELVTVRTLIRHVFGQLQDAEHLLVAVGELVCFGVDDGDTFIEIIKALAVECDAVADVDGRAVVLLLGVLQAFHQELEERVKAQRFRAVRRRVMRIERAGEAVDFVDGMDVVRDLRDAFVEAVVAHVFLEDEERAAADMRDGGRWRHDACEDVRDVLQKLFLRVIAEYLVELVKCRDVDDERCEIFAVLAVVVDVLQAGHQHAAVPHEPCHGVGQEEVALHVVFLRSGIDVFEMTDEADNLAVLVNRRFRCADGVELAANEAVADGATDDAPFVDDVVLVVVERIVVDVPADFLVRLAEDGVDGVKAVVVEERAARAEEAAVLVFPEQVELRVLEERAPERQQVIALVLVAEILVEARTFVDEAQEVLIARLLGERVAAHEQEVGLSRLAVEHEECELHPHVAAVGAQDAEAGDGERALGAARDGVDVLRLEEVDVALAVGRVEMAFGKAVAHGGQAVERLSRFSRRNHGDEHVAAVAGRLEVVDAVIGGEDHAENLVEVFRILFAGGFVRRDVVELGAVDARLADGGDGLELDAHVEAVIDVCQRLLLTRGDGLAHESLEFFADWGRQIGKPPARFLFRTDLEIGQRLGIRLVHLQDLHLFRRREPEGGRRRCRDIDEAGGREEEGFGRRLIDIALFEHLLAAFFVGERLAIVPALHLLAADRAQESDLLRRLDALGERVHAELFREADA